MKIKAIASLFNRHKRCSIITTATGEQWLSDGIAMYSMRGMPTLSPEVVLRLFDVPPAKYEKWKCTENICPDTITLEDFAEGETDADYFITQIDWRGKDIMLFPDGDRIFGIDADYFKPLLDEPVYRRSHKRMMTDGSGFYLACKVGFELKAIILPMTLHKIDPLVAELTHVAEKLRRMHDALPESRDEYDGFCDQISLNDDVANI